MISAYCTERVVFQAPAKAPDGYHGSVVTWNDVLTTRIKLEPLSGREFFWAQQIKVEISHKALLPFHPGLNEKMRIVHKDGRIFLIDFIKDLHEKHVVLEIYCHEEKPQ